MFNKCISILSISLLLILTISAVNASGNITDDAVSVDEDFSSFDYLTKDIGNVEDGGVINLTQNYRYESGDKSGIIINKSITINGNNHKLDGKSQSRIFTAYEGNITLNDLILVNGFSDKGGAIFANKSITLNNVIFENNKADEGGAVYARLGLNVDGCVFDANHACDGAAIYLEHVPYFEPMDDVNGTDEDYNESEEHYNETDVDYNETDDDYNETDAGYDDEESDDDKPQIEYAFFICNSDFKNSQDIFRGLIYSSSNPIKIANCTFSNSTSDYGTAILSEFNTVAILNTTFQNLYAKKSGGAIAVARISVQMLLDNCSFINVSSNNNGGAICADISYYDLVSGDKLIVNNTKFRNSKSKFGGAMLVSGGALIMENSIFEDNTAACSGGAVYLAQCSSNIVDSTFKNNSINSTIHKGSAITAFEENLNITGSRFINNSPYAIYIAQNEYNIVDCYFTGNTEAIFTTYSTGYLDNNYTGDAIKYDDEGYYVLIINATGADLNMIENEIETTYLPARFDSREWGWVSHVKNQGKSGACWVFSTISALESAILKSTGVEYNLSVQNAHKVISKYSKYGHDKSTEGGFTYLLAHFLLSWYGAIPAEDNEFDLYGRIADPVISPEAVHVQDIVWVEGRKNFTDNDGIKRAILKYGAVTSGISLILDSIYYNNSTSSSYDDSSLGAGHAICIVGWDDNYPAGNFNITPPGNGAWIVKDSYGESVRDHGYIYVSYYDTEIGFGDDNIAFSFDNWENYNKNYQTDIAGTLTYTTTTMDEYWDPTDFENLPVVSNYTYKNIYTAIEDDFIAAVGTYFELDEDYTVEIYVNGKLKHTQTGISPFKGFSTVKLTKQIPIKKGDEFEAVMKKRSITLIEDSEVIPQMCSSMVDDGNGWMDLSDMKSTISLKVYTKPLVNLTYQIAAADVSSAYNGGKYLTVNVGNVFGEAIKGAKVTVKLSNGVSKTYSSDSKGQVKFSTDNLAVKSYAATITVQNSGNYLETTSNAKIIVKKASPKITAKKKTFKASVKTKKYAITLKDLKGKAIKNAKFTLKVKGKTYSAKTNSKGKATFKITKLSKKGKYNAVITYNGNSCYSKVTKKVKIIVK